MMRLLSPARGHLVVQAGANLTLLFHRSRPMVDNRSAANTPPVVHARALMESARFAMREGRLADAERDLAFARSEAAAAGDAALLIEIGVVAVLVARRGGRREQVDSELTSINEFEFRIVDPLSQARLHEARFLSAEFRGDLEGAEQAARSSRQYAESARDPGAIGRADLNLAVVASMRGESSTALLRYGSALANFTAAGEEYGAAMVGLNIGTLQLEMGEPASALEYFGAARAELSRLAGSTKNAVLALVGRAQALAALGRGAEALEAGKLAVREAHAHGTATLATAYLGCGAGYRVDGETREALACFEVAQSLAGQRQPWDAGQASMEIARLHVTDGRHGDAFTALEHAARSFGALGATAQAARVVHSLATLRREVDERLTIWVSEVERRVDRSLGHAIRVATAAQELGTTLGLSGEELRWLELAALLHDIGNDRLPRTAFQFEILPPAGRAVIALHVDFGADILRAKGFPRVVIDAVRHHHERWDGTGYPDGLAGEAIPRLARIIAVVERHDALQSGREKSRLPLGPLAVSERLRLESGEALDPYVVEALLATGSTPTVVTPAVTVPMPRSVPATRVNPPQDSLEERVSHALGPSYKLGGELGEGGMSRVFRAANLLLDRTVVVKVLPPGGGPEAATRFRQEMAVAARLVHPNIVPILHAGVAEDLAFFVMPFIEGGSVEDVMRPEGLPLALALRVLTGTARALEYAHIRGVTHRDIKPANVLLSDGHALLADFGIASIVQGSDTASGSGPRLTRTGMVIGTPGHMAPEHLLGADPAPTMDVYAWGALAYELLSGVPPFDEPTVNSMNLAHLTKEPRPLRELRPDLPVALLDVVTQSLLKVAEERPRHGGDLATQCELATLQMSQSS